jgi:4-amino-4-deoxy-L-arabinose transferase-like glycosyltransferase
MRTKNMRLKQIIQTDWLVLLLFTILVFLFRLPTFYEFGVSNNGDEGLYLLMARDLLDGKPPYTGVWDNKPIGIYIIYSLALILFGNSVVSIPVIACIAISISCFLLYKFGRLIGDNDPQIGFLAGLLYAIFSTGNDELSANTEIFFVGFTIFSVYQLFQVTSSNSVRRNSIRLFLIGLAMGIALTIKQVVIFEFIAIAIITAIALRFSQPKERRYKLKHLWQIYISLFSGFIIPTALVALYFLASGHFSDYIFANFTANLLRVTGETITVSSLGAGWLTQFKRNLFLFLGLSLAPFYLMAVGKKK